MIMTSETTVDVLRNVPHVRVYVSFQIPSIATAINPGRRQSVKQLQDLDRLPARQ